MKRINVLELKREEIYDTINGIETRIENINSRKKNEFKSILEKYIDTYDGFVVRYFSDKVSVYVKDSNYSLLDMYVYDEWKSDSRSYNRIDFSTSSFRTEFTPETDMFWTAERFEVLAFYSKALADFTDDILAEFNTVNDKYWKMVEALYEAKRPLNKEVREINEKISKLEDEELMSKLMSDNGLMIEPEEGDYLPRFQVKFDWELHSVKSIRGMKKSASGKSIDLQVSVRRGYGDEKRLEVIDVDRVRFDNVRSFIRSNQNQIV